jgi:hypothetical protein
MPGFACGLSMCVLGIPVASLQIPGTPRPGLLDWARLPVPVSPSRHPAIGHAQVRVTGGRSFRVISVIDREECGLKWNVAPIQWCPRIEEDQHQTRNASRPCHGSTIEDVTGVRSSRYLMLVGIDAWNRCTAGHPGMGRSGRSARYPPSARC